MFTDYDRVGPVIDVRWSGHLKAKAGDRIKAIGRMTTPTRLDAWWIEGDDGTIYEVAHEISTGGQPATPILGKVISSQSYGEFTLMSVFPTGSKAFFFQDLAAQQPFLLVPEFWAYLEDRADWEQLAFRPLRNIFDEIPHQAEETLNIGRISWWLQRQGYKTGEFETTSVPMVLGALKRKLERAERLPVKSRALDDLRRHLVACSSCQRRNWALEETLEEGAILLEQTAIAVYSALDVFAHLVNTVYGLQIPQLQCGFTALLRRPASLDGKEEPSWNPLDSGEPLQVLLEGALSSWIEQVREVRHFIAHYGCLEMTHGRSPKAHAMWHPDPLDLHKLKVFEVDETVSLWVRNLRFLLVESFGLMQARAETICNSIPDDPAPPQVEAAKPSTSAVGLAADVVRLLKLSDEEEPQRLDFLYNKLDRKWQRLWPRDEFRAYVSALRNVRLQPGVPGMSGLGEDERAILFLLADYQGKRVRLAIEARKLKGRRPALVLSPLTFPQSATQSTILTEFHVKQSGRETGWRRAIFGGALTNMSDVELQDVHIHVFHSDVRWADAEIGTLKVGENRPFEFLTSDEVAEVHPPGGKYLLASLLQDPLQVRVTYNRSNEHGSLWADDFRTSGPRDEAPSAVQIPAGP